MYDDRFVNKFIFEQQLFKVSLNKILFNIIQRQNQLFNYLFQEKEEQCIQRKTVENLLNQILDIIDKLKRIYLQLKTKKIFTSTMRSEQIQIPIHHINKQINKKNNQKSSQLQFNAFFEQTLKVYWRSISSNNLFINIRKSQSNTYLGNYIYHSSINNHCNFKKLNKIKRIHQRITINESSHIKTFVHTSQIT
jgi:hypothetical protein